MLAVTQAVGVIFPLVPAMYHKPTCIDDIINQTITRVLDQHGIHIDLAQRWQTL